MEHFEKLNYHHESYMYVQFVLSSVYQLILLTAVKKCGGINVHTRGLFNSFL